MTASHCREQAQRLEAAKAGRTIAVVLPVADPGELRAASEQLDRLVEAGLCAGLLDEAVLIDNAGGGDEASEQPPAAPVRRLDAAELAPGHGHCPGRGEAVWKSLFATRSEILVIVDPATDIVDSTLRLLESLLGHDDRTLAVACRDDEDDLVTTLVARPLLALHAPQLSRLRQPLSRSWAVRRDMLEMLPIPVGAGVDIALTLDVEAMEGLDAIAEVTLPTGTANPAARQPGTADEARRALQTIIAIERRMPMRMPFADDPVVLGVPADAAEGGEATQVEVRERPPVAGVAGYARRFG